MRCVMWLIIAVSILSTAVFAEETPSDPFTLTTTAFLDQGALPVLYTCDGKDITPALTWSNVPAKTQALALIVSDEGAPNGPFYHFVLYNIPKSISSLPEGMIKAPTGSLYGKNNWNKTSYNGPCPPKGTAHTYTFMLYALDTKLALTPGADAKTVLAAMKNHVIQTVKLTAVYSRWLN